MLAWRIETRRTQEPRLRLGVRDKGEIPVRSRGELLVCPYVGRALGKITRQGAEDRGMDGQRVRASQLGIQGRRSVPVPPTQGLRRLALARSPVLRFPRSVLQLVERNETVVANPRAVSGDGRAWLRNSRAAWRWGWVQQPAGQAFGLVPAHLRLDRGLSRKDSPRLAMETSRNGVTIRSSSGVVKHAAKHTGRDGLPIRSTRC